MSRTALADHADDLSRIAASTAPPALAALLRDQADATRRLADLYATPEPGEQDSPAGAP